MKPAKRALEHMVAGSIPAAPTSRSLAFPFLSASYTAARLSQFELSRRDDAAVSGSRSSSLSRGRRGLPARETGCPAHSRRRRARLHRPARRHARRHRGAVRGCRGNSRGAQRAVADETARRREEAPRRQPPHRPEDIAERNPHQPPAAPSLLLRGRPPRVLVSGRAGTAGQLADPDRLLPGPREGERSGVGGPDLDPAADAPHRRESPQPSAAASGRHRDPPAGKRSSRTKRGSRSAFPFGPKSGARPPGSPSLRIRARRPVRLISEGGLVTPQEFYFQTWSREMPKFDSVMDALDPARLDYRPHPKSRSAAEMVTLLARFQEMLVGLMETGVIDYKDFQADDYDE